MRSVAASNAGALSDRHAWLPARSCFPPSGIRHFPDTNVRGFARIDLYQDVTTRQKRLVKAHRDGLRETLRYRRLCQKVRGSNPFGRTFYQRKHLQVADGKPRNPLLSTRTFLALGEALRGFPGIRSATYRVGCLILETWINPTLTQ
jgi:hypothetical protein